MTIKGIIFDLGSTLIRFSGDWKITDQTGAEAMSNWFKKKRIKHDQKAFVDAFLSERAAGFVVAQQTDMEVTTTASLEKTIKKMNMSDQAVPLISDAIKIYLEAESKSWFCYDDTIPTLKMLKRQGYFMGLYSNAMDDPFVQRLVNQYRLRPLLSPTFSSAGLGWRKPKAEPFQLIAERWEIPTNEIVVVGDNLRTDILGAQNAGMAGILITKNEAASNVDYRHIKPTITIPSLATLPGVLGKL
ncbi:HAD family hydrolase [Anaerolineales bacterium HSG24]|nr:HAD family hydrolase [Anaerolineales bacterium HSG24]